MSERRRIDLVAVLVAYVLPLTLLLVVLVVAGLAQLAGYLLAVEVLVVGAVVVARRRPVRTGPQPPSRRPWLVPLVMVGVIGAIVAVGALAARGG